LLGCQLSLVFNFDIDEAGKKVQAAGIIFDIRRPNVMRIAPAPLYNSFSDVFDFVSALKKVL
jgi:kynureninase